jgi:glutathionyl-hydroquinone reductase
MFCLTGDKQISQQLVKELDSVFSSRSYLIDQYLTVADVALFYSLQAIMVRLRLVFSFDTVYDFT